MQISIEESDDPKRDKSDYSRSKTSLTDAYSLAPQDYGGTPSRVHIEAGAQSPRGDTSSPLSPASTDAKRQPTHVAFQERIVVEEYDDTYTEDSRLLDDAVAKVRTIGTCKGPSKWLSWTQSLTGDEMDRCFMGARPDDDDKQRYTIPICIPMYNEEASELMITLKSIYKMSEVLPKSPPHQLKVCIIQDGYAKASETAKQLFRTMFPPEEYTIGGTNKSWEDLLRNSLKHNMKMTVVLQSPNLFGLSKMAAHELWGENWATMSGGLKGFLDISLIIKVDNRKKHNSHDIFFRGFADHFNPEFCFATDCGTYFERHCLRLLLQRITTGRNVIAVTGRQRVMSKRQQPDCQDEGPIGWALRWCQAFDYEASTVVFNGCFSILGCLAVIPGPCGLFRLEPLLEKTMQRNTESPLDFYMNYAHRAEEDKDMIKGNTILAEDRVLTYAALYLTRGRWNVVWCPGAIFYFQSETSLRSLVAQRRRWLNGTIAAYIFTLKELGRQNLPHSHPYLKVVAIRYLTRLMLLVYGLICLLPSLMIFGLHSSMFYIIGDDDINLLSEILLIALAATWFFAFISFSTMQHRTGYDPRLFAMVMIPNGLASILLVYSLGYSAIHDPGWIQWLGFFYFFLPAILNMFIPDFSALLTLLNPLVIVTYFLFMPTMQGYFLSFSVSRTFDLSWGNRAGIGSEQAHLKRETQSMMVIQYVVNGIFLVIVMVCHNASLIHLAYAALGVLLVGPTAIIAVFSALDAFGLRVFLICLSCEIFLLCVHEGWLGEHLEDVSKWKDIPILKNWDVHEGGRLLIHQAAVLVVCFLFKIFFKVVDFVRGKCFRNTEKAYDAPEISIKSGDTVRGARSFLPMAMFATRRDADEESDDVVSDLPGKNAIDRQRSKPPVEIRNKATLDAEERSVIEARLRKLEELSWRSTDKSSNYERVALSENDIPQLLEQVERRRQRFQSKQHGDEFAQRKLDQARDYLKNVSQELDLHERSGQSNGGSGLALDPNLSDEYYTDI